MPAGVFEYRADAESGRPFLEARTERCLHCKACEIKDPSGNLAWQPPWGGSGPRYCDPP